MPLKSSSRNPALDLIRCIALFCVVGIHFYINTGFYAEPIGPQMYILVLLRSAMQVCVPLFLLLSGYLLRFRKPTKTYYLKITHTLAVYCCASVLCILYQNLDGQNPVSLKEAISGIFGFYSAEYAWYIEMYIGLFLVIPFLNVMYNHLETKEAKRLLLFVLLFCTAVPPIANIWRIFDPQWWLIPSSSANYNTMLPDWWIWMYPITYYCIGCYLNEYPFRMRSGAIFLLFLASVLFSGTFNYYRSYGSVFITGTWQDWESLLVVVPAVLLFGCIAKLDLTNIPAGFKSLLARMSDWSLGAYLVSWIFDRIFYPMLNAHQPVLLSKLPYFPLIVTLICICSLFTSAAINLLIRSVSDILFKRKGTLSQR